MMPQHDTADKSLLVGKMATLEGSDTPQVSTATVALPPYREPDLSQLRILRLLFRKPTMEYMPPTKGVQLESSEGQASVWNRHFGPKETPSPDGLAKWIVDCRLKGLDMDLGRVVRYLLANTSQDQLVEPCIEMVQYLVTKERVDLNQTDIHGRSVFFYSIDSSGFSWFGYHPLRHRMLDTLGGLFPDKLLVKKMLNAKDTLLSWTPLKWALNEDDSTAIEFYIAQGADFYADDSLDGVKRRIQWPMVGSEPNGDFIGLRSAYQRLLESYNYCPNLRYRMGSTKDSRDVPFAFVGKQPINETITMARLMEQENLRDNDFGGGELLLKDATTAWFLLEGMNQMDVYFALRSFHMYSLSGFKVFDHPSFSNTITRCNFWFKRPSIQPRNPDLAFLDPVYTEFKQIIHIVTRRERAQRNRRVGQQRELVAPRQHKFADNFRNCARAIHLERTLHETYFPGLSTQQLDNRNKDQTISKEFGSLGKQSGRSREGILVVPQAWIWAIADRVLLTAYSDNPKSSRNQTKHATLQVGWLLADFILRFGRTQSRRSGHHKDEAYFRPPLDMYESNVAGLLSEVQDYVQHGPRGLSLDVDAEKQRRFIHAISNIQEELVIIKHILGQQQEIFGKVITCCKKLIDDQEALFEAVPAEHTASGEESSLSGSSETSNARVSPELRWANEDRTIYKQILRADVALRKYQERVSKIEGDARRIEKAIENQLNLRRTFASMSDARTGVLLSASVIGFTITTVIFTPLSFMSSLFALPIDQLVQHQYRLGQPGQDSSNKAAVASTSEPSFRSSYIWTWFIVAEVASLCVTGVFIALPLWYFYQQSTKINARDSPDSKPPILHRALKFVWGKTRLGELQDPDKKSRRKHRSTDDRTDSERWDSSEPCSESEYPGSEQSDYQSTDDMSLYSVSYDDTESEGRGSDDTESEGRGSDDTESEGLGSDDTESEGLGSDDTESEDRGSPERGSQAQDVGTEEERQRVDDADKSTTTATGHVRSIWSRFGRKRHRNTHVEDGVVPLDDL